jgi:hypothetical protein
LAAALLESGGVDQFWLETLSELPPATVFAAVQAQVGRGRNLQTAYRVLYGVSSGGEGPKRVRAVVQDKQATNAQRLAATRVLLMFGSAADVPALVASIRADPAFAAMVLEQWKDLTATETNHAPYWVVEEGGDYVPLLPTLRPLVETGTLEQARAVVAVIASAMFELDSERVAHPWQPKARTGREWRLALGDVLLAALERSDGHALAHEVAQIFGRTLEPGDRFLNDSEWWTVVQTLRTRDPVTLREVLAVGAGAATEETAAAKAFAAPLLNHPDAQVQQAAHRLLDRAEYFTTLNNRVAHLKEAARSSPKANNDYVVVKLVDAGTLEPLYAGKQYWLALPGGRVRKGHLDAQGALLEEKLASCTCTLSIESGSVDMVVDSFRVVAKVVPRPAHATRFSRSPPWRKAGLRWRGGLGTIGILGGKSNQKKP